MQLFVIKPIALCAASASSLQVPTVQGVVTHCTDVKPLISVATYLDITSGVEMFQEVLGPMFTPVDKTSKPAKEATPYGEPTLQMRGSKLIKFQQVKLQEMSDEVPTSATPRCANASCCTGNKICTCSKQSRCPRCRQGCCAEQAEPPVTTWCAYIMLAPYWKHSYA
jgi:hypothetical protein